MSKTYRDQPRRREDEMPQKAIDRLCMREARQDIREALTSKEATSAK